MLVWVKDERLLAAVLGRMNKAQKASGELQGLEKRTYRGVDYFYRKEKREEHYYLLDGQLFAFTGREAMLRGVIDRRVGGRQARPASPFAESLSRLPADNAVATVWVNPRVFDREFRLPPEGKGHKAQALQAFLRYWRALDALALSLTCDPTPELRVTVQGRVKSLPPGAQKWLGQAARPSGFWEYVPETAVLTVAGRDDLAAKLEMLDGFLPADDREKLRQGLQRSIGTAHRPGLCRGCVTPRRAGRRLLRRRPGRESVSPRRGLRRAAATRAGPRGPGGAGVVAVFRGAGRLRPQPQTAVGPDPHPLGPTGGCRGQISGLRAISRRGSRRRSR